MVNIMSIKVNSVQDLGDKILKVVDEKWITLGMVQKKVRKLGSSVSIESVAFVCGILYTNNKLSFRNHTTEDHENVKYFMVREYL